MWIYNHAEIFLNNIFKSFIQTSSSNKFPPSKKDKFLSFSFIKNSCNNIVKKTKITTKADQILIDETKKLTKNLRLEMNKQNLNQYLKSVINISFLTNKYINDEEPWKLKKTNIDKMNNVLHLSLEQIAKISILLSPIIPNSTSKVLTALNIDKKKRNLSFLDGKNLLEDEVNINELNILFKKISAWL